MVLLASGLSLYAKGFALIALRYWWGGCLLLAQSSKRDPHPQESAVISASAYTYYFAQAIANKIKALSYKLTAHSKVRSHFLSRSTLSVFYYFANKLVETDPHPLFIFHNVKRHFTWRNTPVTVLGTMSPAGGMQND